MLEDSALKKSCPITGEPRDTALSMEKGRLFNPGAPQPPSPQSRTCWHQWMDSHRFGRGLNWALWEQGQKMKCLTLIDGSSITAAQTPLDKQREKPTN